jgi:hypothetical protein
VRSYACLRVNVGTALHGDVAGCNARDVSEWAGHHSVAVTLTRYGGLFEDVSDVAIGVMSRWMV